VSIDKYLTEWKINKKIENTVILNCIKKLLIDSALILNEVDFK